MRAQLIYHKGEFYRVKALPIGNDIWLHVNGQTYVVPKQVRGRKASGAGAAKHSDQIVAPMPGKILKVNVKVQDEVTGKQVLIVMEAMKMEYSLVAPFSGQVIELNCNEGDQVELNQLLIKLKAAETLDESKK